MNSSEHRQKPTRRHVVAGAGTAAVAAAAVAVIGGRGPAASQAPGTAPSSAKTASDALGYRETDHVLRYYQTART